MNRIVKILSTCLVTGLYCIYLTGQTYNYALYNQQRGFIHPGGLHTQADFDRVKAQLAAGNSKVKQAYQKLISAAYSQSSVQTTPLESIVRGGGSGENYINAARGATMAYQNALRWKIDGTRTNADAAVRILMSWAKTTKVITGNSDQCLAVGLYGYQFAQAAELMRDYDGWSTTDFEAFKTWMLTLWYPKAIGFLRNRNGTWENKGKWWQAPGHYWSNWGLCNILCVISIGILCDDVYIYNQGMSFFKYDQCGTFHHPRTEEPILNDGLTDFLGNLVVTTVESPLETAAYGQIGQMNESGRDTGHSALALGLAVDIAKVGWNQGDDLFAYMDHRLAAGIEYVAAQTQNIDNLPWTDYHYGSSGYYYTDSRAWLMTAPALGAQTRPYWATVIGIYEGIKGVKMPFAEMAYTDMGIDEGGMGSTSGGYDHLGYSVLMNTIEPQLCPTEQVSTELHGKIEYSSTPTSNLIPSISQERSRGMVNGKTILHNELGGLVNTYNINTNTCLPKGRTITLCPLLPQGENDSGLWHWNTGETTRNITITTDSSYIYRVTYTNSKGINSQLAFFLAVAEDNIPTNLTPYCNDTQIDTLTILYGGEATLRATPSCGWGTIKWSSGQTTETITISKLTSSRQYTATYTNQAQTKSSVTFHIGVVPAIPYVTQNNITSQTDEVIINEGEHITLGLSLPTSVQSEAVIWSNGSSGDHINIGGLTMTTKFTAHFTLGGKEITIPFTVYVKSPEPVTIPSGNYMIEDVSTHRLLTFNGKGTPATFQQGDTLSPDESQVWWIDSRSTRHAIVSLPDSLGLMSSNSPGTIILYSFYFEQPVGAKNTAIHSGVGSNLKYWTVSSDGIIQQLNTLTAYPFRLIPWTGTTSIRNHTTESLTDQFYNLSGQRVNYLLSHPAPGIYISRRKKYIVR